MSTTKNDYLSTKPVGPGVLRHTDVHIPPGEPGERLAVFRVGSILRKICFPKVGDGNPYTAAQWTPRFGTGNAAAESEKGGIKVVASAGYPLDYSLQSVVSWTPESGKVMAGLFRLVLDDATAVGFKLGFANSQNAPFTTNYTDEVVIAKTAGNAAVDGKVRGDSGTERYTLLLSAQVNVPFDVGFVCAPNQFGKWYVNGKFIPFTADQMTELGKLLTTPVSLYLSFAGTSSNNQHVIHWIGGIAEIDN